MNISKFKKGDFITRVNHAVHPEGIADDSYIGTPFKYIGHNKAKIVLLEINRYTVGEDNINTLTTDIWEDGWDYFPMDELKEARKELESIAQGILFKDSLEENQELARGQLVETCDGRWGFIKKVDWHSKAFLRRADYQVQFPSGVGIFRKDELRVVDDPLSD